MELVLDPMAAARPPEVNVDIRKTTSKPFSSKAKAPTGSHSKAAKVPRPSLAKEGTFARLTDVYHEFDADALDISEARMCAELADLIYFSVSEFSWESRLPEPPTPSMNELPIHYRRKLGHYSSGRGFSPGKKPSNMKWNNENQPGLCEQPPGLYKLPSELGGRWQISPVDAKHDGEWNDGSLRLRDGIGFESTSDTQFMLNTCELRHAIIVTFRGTESTEDWLGNIKFSPIMRAPCKGAHFWSRVHRGFGQTYTSVQPAVRATVAGLLEDGWVGEGGHAAYERIIVCGHSLGGALATLCASDLAHLLREDPRAASVEVSAYTFGSPRVGNSHFAGEYDKHVPKTFRFVNDRDIVPMIPPPLLGFRHVGQLVHMSQTGLWLNPSDDVISESASATKSKASNKTLLDELMKRVADHNSYHGYLQLLRYHRAMSKLSAAQRDKIREAWMALTMTSAKVARQLVVQRDETTGLALLVTSRVVQPDSEAMGGVLRDELAAEGVEAETIVKAMRQITRDRIAATFQHFVPAVYAILFDEPSTRRRRRQLATLGDIFDRYDANLDGFISREEFKRVWINEREWFKATFPSAFRAIDKDEEGAELNAALDEVFTQLDLRKDALLSRIEFSTLAHLTNTITLGNGVGNQATDEGYDFDGEHDA